VRSRNPSRLQVGKSKDMRLINTFSVRQGDRRVAPSEGQRHDASLSATATAGRGVDIWRAYGNSPRRRHWLWYSQPRVTQICGILWRRNRPSPRWLPNVTPCARLSPFVCRPTSPSDAPPEGGGGFLAGGMHDPPDAFSCVPGDF
jgi:hypothetical protein